PSRAMVGAVVAPGHPEYLRLSYERPLRVVSTTDWNESARKAATVEPPVTVASPVPRTGPIPHDVRPVERRFLDRSEFATPPARRPELAECTFYHCLDLPGLGTVPGQWDLRPGVDSYFGGYDLAGATVLEIGTASGFVCFEMERRGADVIAFDLDEGLTYDMF